VGTRGHAPFKMVLTHGFTVDGEGRKESKSLGNAVQADKAIRQYGADVLRLWVSMVDFREDMRLSDELLKRVAEGYRKIRNTCRFLLSNLYDFDPAAGHEVTEPLDQYAMAVHHEFEGLLHGRAQRPALLRRGVRAEAALRPGRDVPDQRRSRPIHGPTPRLHR
jgi:isoleucyl-tRNA synthetase